jgi:putative sterol carrier protein
VWAEIGATFLWSISEGKEQSRWLLTLRGAPTVRKLSVSETTPSDCQLICSSEEVSALLRGELTPQKAFLDGRIQLAGNLRAALRFNVLIEQLLRHQTSLQ